MRLAEIKGRGGREEKNKRSEAGTNYCRLLTNSIIDLDRRTVGVVASSASMLLLCTSLGRD
jgi:hypothetical protein